MRIGKDLRVPLVQCPTCCRVVSNIAKRGSLSLSGDLPACMISGVTLWEAAEREGNASEQKLSQLGKPKVWNSE